MPRRQFGIRQIKQLKTRGIQLIGEPANSGRLAKPAFHGHDREKLPFCGIVQSANDFFQLIRFVQFGNRDVMRKRRCLHLKEPLKHVPHHLFRYSGNSRRGRSVSRRMFLRFAFTFLPPCRRRDEPAGSFVSFSPGAMAAFQSSR